MEPLDEARSQGVRRPRFDRSGQAPDGLEIDSEDESALSHLARRDLQPPSGRRAEIEDPPSRPEQAPAPLDLLQLVRGARPQAFRLRLAEEAVAGVIPRHAEATIYGMEPTKKRPRAVARGASRRSGLAHDGRWPQTQHPANRRFARCYLGFVVEPVELEPELM